MKYLIYAAVLMLAACVPKPIILPDGRQGYSIDCSGLCCDIGDCMNKAAKVCGGPYRVLESNGESTGGAVVPVGNGAVFMQGIHRTMIVSCEDH